MSRTLVILLLPSFLLLSVSIAQQSSTLDPEKLILMQIGNDMTYGTDEYFGESRDLFYADQIIPTERQKAIKEAQSAAAGNSASSQRSDNSNNSNTSQTSNNQDSGNTSAPASGSGSSQQSAPASSSSSGTDSTPATPQAPTTGETTTPPGNTTVPVPPPDPEPPPPPPCPT